MNKERRKRLCNVSEQLEILKEQLEDIQSDEQDAYDNLPEPLQAGEKGDMMQEAINNIESAVSSIEEAITYIEEASE